jgi:hypothetical protein
VSVLLPPGIEKLAEAPHTLHDAILQGLQFLSFEELPKEDQPARAIWFDTKKLKAHFDAVEKRNKERYETDKDGNSKEIEDPVQNQVPSLIAEE